MRADEALYTWLNTLMTFYPDTAVPKNASLPYGTYEGILDHFSDTPVASNFNLWFRTESEALPNTAALEIGRAIGAGGKMLKVDGGYLWVKRGAPWCRVMTDPDEPSIKRRYLNVVYEFLTEN